VTCGFNLRIPSAILRFEPVGEVSLQSYKYLPGMMQEDTEELKDNVTAPFATETSKS